MSTSELLQQVRLLDPVSQTDRTVDVLIDQGRIKTVEPQQADWPDGMAVRDCQGMVLAPGLVDLYSHSGEPGFEERETLDSLLSSATAGGFTRLTLLPNTRPALDNPASIEWMRSQISQKAAPVPQVQIWGALTLGAKGEQMVELGELAKTGIAGFADGKPWQNSALLRRTLEYGQGLGKPIALCCCDHALAGNGVVREGRESMRLGLSGNPALSETAALAALLECIAEIGTPVHLMRISTARSVALIQAAKAQGLPITASTTWMHLLLDITAVGQSYDPSLHLEPPLGNPSDRAALIRGLETGVLDAIAIDHSPYTYEEKTVSFTEAPAGAIGLELALPLLWQTFVATHQWSALDLWRFLSTQPAQCLHQRPGSIVVGADEFVLFAPQQTWKVTAQTLKSRSTNTPWLHQEILGQVVKTGYGQPDPEA